MIGQWISSQGGVEAILKSMAQHGKNRNFLQEHRREWMGLYPKKWTAVFKEELVEVAETLEELIEKLQGKQIPSNETVIDFLDDRRFMFVRALSAQPIAQVAA